MAILVRAKSFLSSSLSSLTRSQRCNHTLGERGLQAELYSGMAPAPNPALRPIDTSKWKKIQASKVGISLSMISYPSWIVLKILHKGGFEAYLVGGCVRDLLLNRTPKDFDVITTANLKQIRKKFHRAEIIGKRFPICRVHIKGSIIEVSSFETVARHDADKEKALSSLIPKICDEKDLIRWRNSRNRDFTINSLFFDPFTCNIYDYNGGMSDLKSLKIRGYLRLLSEIFGWNDCWHYETLMENFCHFSYPARILRGLRIAARLCLSFSKDTERAMYDLSASIGGLDKAAYISQHRATKNSMMLMKLFFNLDKLVSCDHPADSSLWVGLLMFHLALVNNPQDALVIWTFASVLYHGNWKEGVEFAREYTKLEVKFVPEISEFSETKSDEDLAKEVAQFASLVQDSVGVLTETSNLFESMSRYPFSACSGLRFLSERGVYVFHTVVNRFYPFFRYLYQRSTAKNTAKLFDLMVEDIRSFINGRGRMSPEINFHLLGIGDPCETRFVLGKIILETMKAGPRGDATEIGNDEKDLQPKATEEILSNNEIPGKKVKKNAPSSFIPDGNRGMLKKQKLVDDDTATKNQEMPRVVRELNLREEDEMDNLEKVLGKEEVKERTEEHKGRAGKERSGHKSCTKVVIKVIDRGEVGNWIWWDYKFLNKNLTV
ncbi:hypothetical protein GOBAR_DD16802 [Gossypium barbadense]|nr:hypothetical protein GOBAR_DD16802 [Gossypium barbadense]